MTGEKTKRDLLWLAGAGVFLVSLGFHLLYFRHGVANLVDLGVACVDSERILNGQIPGRDFFEPYGPGRFYLTALAFKLFGPSLLCFSWVCLVLLSLKDLLVFLVARRFASLPWALFAAALAMLVHGPIHKVFLMLAGMLVLSPALRMIAKPGRASGIRFGLGIVAAGLLRYDVGVMGLLCALWLVPLLRKKERGTVRGFLEGLALLGAPVLLLYVPRVDWKAMVHHHWVRIQSLEEAAKTMPGLSALFTSDNGGERLFVWLLVLFGAITVLGVFLVVRHAFFKGGDARQAASLAVLLFLSLLLLNQVRLGLKFSRFAQVAPPFFILLVHVLNKGTCAFKSRAVLAKARGLFPLLGALVLAVLVYTIWNDQGESSQDSIAVLKLRENLLDRPRGHVYFKMLKEWEIDEVLQFLEAAVPQGETIFAGPTCPLFHFLANLPNPTPFTDFSFYNFSDENQKKVIQSIEAAKVEYVVDWPRPLTGFLFECSTPMLAEYLRVRFNLVKRIGRIELLKRRR